MDGYRLISCIHKHVLTFHAAKAHADLPDFCLICLNSWNFIGDKLLMNYHEYRVSPALISTKKLKLDDSIQKIYHSPLVIKAFKNICIIADLLKKKDHDDKVSFNYFFIID